MTLVEDVHAQTLTHRGKDAAESPVRIVDGAEEIGEALEPAEKMFLNGCGFGGLNVNFAEIALRNAAGGVDPRPRRRAWLPGRASLDFLDEP